VSRGLLMSDSPTPEAKALRVIQLEHALSQVELADRLGVTQAHMNRMLRGLATPGPKVYAAVRRKFGLSLHLLAGLAERPVPMDVLHHRRMVRRHKADLLPSEIREAEEPSR
jgi:transcriptional regulator with XRE-family HTH domain